MASGFGAVVLGLVALTAVSVLCLSYFRIFSHPMDLIFTAAVALVGSAALGYYTRDK